ncbi:MAG: helix-turn-helix domain-containing protein [Methanolinea sp.]|jgi:DNA-binding transcriptional ArsR family regulator|nr:helix-turn-helix domain-containing protein [Methanolinea sp.]
MDPLQEDTTDSQGPSSPAGEVVVLQPGDERAQKIGKAIASQSANDILHALQDGPKTAGDLASSLAMPMGTVKYHLENLLDAGLLEVRETRYSVKGREIKVYGLKDQLLIVAPRVQNIRSILLKYATLFGIVILASLAGYAMLPIATAPPGMGGSGDTAFQAEKTAGIMAEPAMRADSAAQVLSLDPVLAFFLGGCLVILILLLYEVAVWRRLK